MYFYTFESTQPYWNILRLSNTFIFELNKLFIRLCLRTRNQTIKIKHEGDILIHKPVFARLFTKKQHSFIYQHLKFDPNLCHL
jgi:hypothetical protein